MAHNRQRVSVEWLGGSAPEGGWITSLKYEMLRGEVWHFRYKRARSDPSKVYLEIQATRGKPDETFSRRVQVKYTKTYSSTEWTMGIPAVVHFRNNKFALIAEEGADAMHYDVYQAAKFGPKITVTVDNGPVAVPLAGAENNVHDDIDKLLASGALQAEIRVVCKGGQVVPAHQFILMARSPVFRAMFSMQSVESKSKTISIRDYDSDTVKVFLQFLNTDQVSNLDEHAQELFIMADKYQVPLLKATCEDYIAKHVTRDNTALLLAMLQSIPSITITKAVFQFLNPDFK
ncbi:Speckle-type POZ protein [Halotydeus destructor]|nr:Speckle-type POZ protein [Halotydeus destructor]